MFLFSFYQFNTLFWIRLPVYFDRWRMLIPNLTSWSWITMMYAFSGLGELHWE